MVALLAIVYWRNTGERAVPALIEALESTDLQAQMLAAQELKHIGQPAAEAIPTLVALATKPGRPSLSLEAAGALPPIDLSAGRRVMRNWLPKLQDPDPQIRREAAAVLGALGPVAKPAVRFLLGLAHDPNTTVRERVVRALDAIGIPPDLVMGGLREALHDPEWAVRYAAIMPFSFGEPPNPEMLIRLRELTQDPNQMVARLAQLAVASAERPVLAPAPLPLDQGETQIHALLQLARRGPRAAHAVPKLTSLLTAQRPIERYLAANALESIGSAAAEAVPALQHSLQDQDPVVREAVAEALKRIQDMSRPTSP
jgi:HEAT repeat protein